MLQSVQFTNIFLVAAMGAISLAIKLTVLRVLALDIKSSIMNREMRGSLLHLVRSH